MSYVLTDRDARSKEHVSRVLESAAGSDVQRARSLLTDLFPQLKNLFRSGKYGDRNEDRIQRGQRVASLDFYCGT